MATRNNSRKKRKLERSRSRRANHVSFEQLEPRNMLAGEGVTQLLPDLFAWESQSRGYLHDYHIEGNLLRFSTALANQGDGNLEIRGGQVNGDVQEVNQRIYNSDGTWTERLAGEFTYHSGHGHIHFDGYAIYNLRTNVDGVPGDVVASGGKISFCLIDIARYDPNAGSSQYGGCGATVQGITAGWSDVYGSGLSDQWIDITGINDGDYFLEVIVDPDDQLLESDETNNTTVIPITINGGPGDQGDRYESNNGFATATNWGITSYRNEAGLSIHVPGDNDYYKVIAADDGTFTTNIGFSNSLGNLNLYIYDSAENLVTSSVTTDDGESVSWAVNNGETFYIRVNAVGDETNAYELEVDGPGDIVTQTIVSADVPVSIPDSPGGPVTSTLEGPDMSLSDVNLLLTNLSHTYVGDLEILLTSPAGTTVTILESAFQGGNGFLGGGNNFTNTILDDQSANWLGNASAPHTGSFHVDNTAAGINDPFAAFNGESSLGTWTLTIEDQAGSDTGTLHEWGIMFTGIDNDLGDQFEQNDAFPQATNFGTIGYVSENELSIHKTTDVDFYRFIASNTGEANIAIGFDHNLGNLDAVVYDSNLDEVFRSESLNNDERFSVAVTSGELYYVEVYGVNNATNDYTLELDIPVDIGETGIITGLSGRAKFVAFQRSYVNPVILLSPVGSNSADPSVARLKGVYAHGFSVQIDEFDYLDNLHPAEDISYVVLEAGNYTLENGTTIEVGVSTSDNLNWSSVNFNSTFATTPVVFGQYQLESVVRTKDALTLTPRFQNVDSDGFDFRLQQQEANGPLEATHRVHWMAVEAATGFTGDSQYEVGTASIGHQPQTINFNNVYSPNSVLLSSIQTFNGSDTAFVRSTALTNQSATLFVSEEQSLDNEMNHTAETVGYFIFNDPTIFRRGDSGGSGGRPAGDSGDVGDTASDDQRILPVESLQNASVLTGVDQYPARDYVTVNQYPAGVYLTGNGTGNRIFPINFKSLYQNDVTPGRLESWINVDRYYMDHANDIDHANDGKTLKKVNYKSTMVDGVFEVSWDDLSGAFIL